MLDAFWIVIAFFLGVAARQVGLPPMVGYLAAGFVLFALGVDSGETLDQIADIGITLLLFSIGLKLRITTLLQPQVWAVASIHMGVTTLVLGLGVLVLTVTGLSLLADVSLSTALLLGFALSFSSTIFAVKVLEDKGEMSSIYGRTAIGILIMQDLAAVLFLAVSTGKIPSPWALLLLLCLFPMRWLLLRMMDRSGHGELLILFGLSVALGGAQLFDLVSIKGDLGALILGVMLSSHLRANELAKTLLGFKDLFLVSFFLSVGLKGIPGVDTILIAVLLVLMLSLKSALYFWLLARFRMRTRTSFLVSLNLSNYSEFGLIVAAIGAANQWLADEWLITIAVVLSLSFVVAAPLNTSAHALYARYRQWLVQFQSPQRLPDEEQINPGDATVLIFGMGRVGTGAYDELCTQAEERVVGIDLATEVVERHQKAGREVIRASATDADFWSRIRLDQSTVNLVMLAMPQREENVFAAKQLIKNGYSGHIVALAKFNDDIPELKAAGVHNVFNLYAEAGIGFADSACRERASSATPG